MKTLLLTLATAALAALTATAQEDKPKPAAEAPAQPAANRFTPEARLKSLTASLGLNADQQTKMKVILEESRGKIEAFRDLPREERRVKAAEFRKTEQEKISAILTPEQQAKYKAEITERAAAARNRADAPKKEGEAKPEANK